jgi:preprotein translocase subunit SecE
MVRVMVKTSPIQFFRQVKQEVKKVTWPSKKDVMRATMMVIIIVAIASTLFFFVDMFFGAIVSAIFKY